MRALPASSRGISLIEVLVSLGVAAVAMGSIAVLAGRSIYVIGDVRQELIAANLAQEGIELTRNVRDNNWASGNTLDTLGSCPTPANSWRRGMCDNASGGYQIDSTALTLAPVVGQSDVLCRQNTNGLLVHPPGGGATCPGGTTTTSFRRHILLNTPPAGSPNRTSEMIVTSVVTWCRGPVPNCVNPRSVSAVDHLRNWFPR